MPTKKEPDRFDAIHRRKRTSPTSTDKRVTAQPRDILWFQKIHEHGPLSSSFLHAFSVHMRRSEKRAKERLTDLFNEDRTPDGGVYLCRPPQQFRTIDSRYNELVYDVTPASISVLKNENLWEEKSSKRSGPWLHNYMVSCITASIELAAMERDDLIYIPQSKILSRAKAELRYPTNFIDPNSRKKVTKDIIPDALFGLEYLSSGQSHFRFFLIEADRGTEPATTKNFNRKSHLRNLLQYRDYIAGGKYKNHLRLTAPLMVLHVSSDKVRLAKMKTLTVDNSGSQGNSYMCFAHINGFGGAFKPGKPQSHLLEDDWARAGRAPFNIGLI